MDVPEVATEAAVNSDWVTHAFGRWTVSPSGVEREVQVYSQLGMLCFQTSLGSEQPSFDFATLSSGTYLVVLTGPSARSAHHVVVAR